MKIMQSLGVIGIGNMGAAILEGLFRKKLMKPSQVMIHDKDRAKARAYAQKSKVRVADSNEALIQKSRIILLAVKPQDLAQTAGEFSHRLKSSQTLISILAGTPVEKLRRALGKKVKLVRAMPNLCALVGESLTSLCGSNRASLKIAQQIFSGCGKTVVLDEKYFDLVTAVSGSGPAYYFLLTELLMAEAMKHGLNQDQAKLLAVQTARGAGILAAGSSEAPAILRERVTSKGGTTAAAFEVFEIAGMSQIVSEAVEAARKRGVELSRNAECGVQSAEEGRRSHQK